MTTTTGETQEIQIGLNAGQVHVLKGGEGAPLLVLHHDIGNFGWQRLYQVLAERHTVYVPDLPGFGRSERPEDARHTRDLAIHMNLMLDRLGLDGLCLVGLGYGGWVAAEMAVMNQQRFQKLVLVAPPGLQPKDGLILDQFLIDTPDYVKSGFANAAGFSAQFGDEVTAEHRTAWEQAREMIARINWKPYMFSQQLPYFLGDVNVSTLIVWGERDGIVPPSCGTDYADLLPNSRLVLLPEAGHFVDMEFPDRLAELVESHLRKT